MRLLLALLLAAAASAAEPGTADLPGFDAPVPVRGARKRRPAPKKEPTPAEVRVSTAASQAGGKSAPVPARKARKRPPKPAAKKKPEAQAPGWTPSGGYAAPHKKRHKKLPAPAFPAAPSGPDRVPLPGGRWAPEVRTALERLLASRGKDAPGYDPESPPVAVVSLDALAPAHAPGDALFSLLVDSAGYRCDAAFLKLVPAPAGRERIRAGFEAFRSVPKAVWTKDASYQMYRKAFYKARREVCALWGARECARWKASLLSGFTVAEATTAAHAALERSLEMPVGVERVGDYPEDPEPVEVQRGLRRIPELEDLCLKLKEQGFELWAMSLSDQASAEAFARTYGPPASPCFETERILGAANEVSSGTLTAEIRAPVPYGTGQAELLLKRIAKSAALVLGGPESRELFPLAEAAVLVSQEEGLPGFEALRREGRLLAQPAFKAVRQPQPLPPPR